MKYIKILFAAIAIILMAANLKAQNGSGNIPPPIPKDQMHPCDTCVVAPHKKHLKGDLEIYQISSRGLWQQTYYGWNYQITGGYNYNLGDASFPQHSWVGAFKIQYNFLHHKHQKFLAQGLKGSQIPKFPRFKAGLEANIGQVTLDGEKILVPSASVELALEFARFSTINPYIGGRGGLTFYQVRGLGEGKPRSQAWTPTYGAVAGVSIKIGFEKYLVAEAIYTCYQITNSMEVFNEELGETLYSKRVYNPTPLTFQVGFKWGFGRNWYPGRKKEARKDYKDSMRSPSSNK